MDKVMINILFQEWADIFSKNVDYLTELDAVAGDADLGLVMSDGFEVVSKIVLEMGENDIGVIFYCAGKEFNKVASSSMGTLLAFGLMNIGKEYQGKTEIADEDVVNILRLLANGVKRIGKANEGEKTFLDGVYPAIKAMEEHKGEDLITQLEKGLEGAKSGVDNAKMMKAVHGRIAFKGDDSIGIIDPGSVVAMLIVQGLLDAVSRYCGIS